MKTDDLKKIIDTLLHQNLMVVNVGTGIEPDPIVGGTKDLSRELVNLFLLYGVSNSVFCDKCGERLCEKPI